MFTVDSQLASLWQQRRKEEARQAYEGQRRQRKDNADAVRKQYMAASVELLSTFQLTLRGKGLVPQDVKAVRRFLAAPTEWDGLKRYQDPEQKRILAAAMKQSEIII